MLLFNKERASRIGELPQGCLQRGRDALVRAEPCAEGCSKGRKFPLSSPLHPNSGTAVLLRAGGFWRAHLRVANERESPER